MTKVNITRLDSVTSNDAAATAAINNNFRAIQDAVENTLSRDGTTPNFMDSDLDLNAHRIINVQEPISDNDVVTKKWVTDIVGNAATYSAEAVASALAAASSAQASSVSAQEAAARASLAADEAAIAKDWATKMDGTVDGVDYSSKYYASQIIPIATDITTVAGISSDVTTVASNATDISTVAGISTDIQNVADAAEQIETIADLAADITAVAAVATDVAAVADDLTNIDAVADDLADIDAVAGDINRVNLVADDISSVHTVAVDISTVIDVADNKTNIDAVAGNSSNINTVAGIASDVTTVASNTSNIASVVSNASNINAVAGDITNINAVAADLTNIDNASTYADNANIWAEGTDEQVAALGGVHSSKGWAQESATGQINSDWTEADPTSKAFILNKPSLATVATSGSYTDLSNTPTIDQSYNALSTNAQSGTAVAEALSAFETLPSQTGHAGEYLTTDGTDASWDNVKLVENAQNENTLGIWQGSQQEWEQAEVTDWRKWQTDVTATTEKRVWYNVITVGSNNSVMVMPTNGGGIYYGPDYSNLSQSNITSGVYPSIVNFDNKFFAYPSSSNTSGTCQISTDGATWTSESYSGINYISDRPASRWMEFNGKLYFCNSGLYESSDGLTWSKTLSSPYSQSPAVVANNGSRIITAGASGTGLMVWRSDDGENFTVDWSMGALSQYEAIQDLVYFNNMFIMFGQTSYKTSTDGETWSANKLHGLPSGGYFLVKVVGDKLIVCTNSKMFYSTDGETWSTGLDLGASPTTLSQAPGKDGIIFAQQNNYVGEAVFSSSTCYTTTTTPTTASTVYSAPNTTSALTITSVGTGTITLSDSQIYNRQAGGDTQTYQDVASLYPNHLAFVDNVGVKIGNTLIADNTPLKTINGESIKGTGNIDTPYRNIGEIVASAVPLTDAGLHLLDGALISGTGSYADFVTYIAGLVSDYPDLFETEANWQTAVSTYGVCGKFVYDSVNNTIRLPKITGFVEGTTTAASLGDITAAGLPKIQISGSLLAYVGSGGVAALSSGSSVLASNSNINSIYGKSTTVQPQSIKALLYIVVAATTKTEIEVDIDEIATDLNGKADVDLSNCTKPHIVETYVNGTSWYRVYSDGWCEQGGITSNTESASVTFLQSFTNTNYTIVATQISDSSYNNNVNIRNKTTSGVVIWANGAKTWVAYGYIR